MRVAILGVGGVGRTLASELRADERVDALLLADAVPERAKVLAGMKGRVHLEARQLDASDPAAVARTIRKWDLVVNATLPKHNLAIMRAALDAGVNYLDIAGTGPAVPGGTPGILEQLELHDRFRDAGLRALLSMGLDPGFTNVLARDVAERLDTIDAVRIRSGGFVNLPGFTSFPLYSRDAFLSDMLIPPSIWLNGRLLDREPMGEPEDFAFPEPVGVQKTYLISHEEIKTLPRFLEKPVARVDFKYALDPHLVKALLALDRLGLLRDDRLIRIGSSLVSFRRALLAAFPEPSALVLPLEGWKAVSLEVEGRAKGVRVVHRADIVMAHQEANRRRSTTAVYYLTACAAAIGAVLLGAGGLPKPGAFPAEALDPAAVLREWAARDLPLSRSERTLPG